MAASLPTFGALWYSIGVISDSTTDDLSQYDGIMDVHRQLLSKHAYYGLGGMVSAHVGNGFMINYRQGIPEIIHHGGWKSWSARLHFHQRETVYEISYPNGDKRRLRYPMAYSWEYEPKSLLQPKFSGWKSAGVIMALCHAYVQLKIHRSLSS